MVQSRMLRWSQRLYQWHVPDAEADALGASDGVAAVDLGPARNAGADPGAVALEVMVGVRPGQARWTADLPKLSRQALRPVTQLIPEESHRITVSMDIGGGHVQVTTVERLSCRRRDNPGRKVCIRRLKQVWTQEL